MRTIVHLSDLHFGRIDARLPGPLIARVKRLRPDVVVVSGDLTQRARRAQFREARRFLDALPRPQVVVPGNHDVPLYDLFSRTFRALANYRRYIGEDLEPAHVDDEIAVLGLNTARALTFKGGRVNQEQIERLRRRLAELDPRLVRIVVTHHPFDLPADSDPRDLVGRADLAMAMFAGAGVQLLLAGHLHIGKVGSTATRYRLGDWSAVVVQAGTATSTRVRDEPNSFNLIRIEAPTIAVERYAWDAAAQDFAVAGVERVALGGTGAPSAARQLDGFRNGR